MTQKNSYPEEYYFYENPKNIEIQNFEPQKLTHAYVCISELPLPPPPWDCRTKQR